MKINTVAKTVEEDLKKEIPDIYPQRYQGYNVVSINYNATVSDIETYWNTEARFREGFSANEENKSVNIPNFFTKVNGMFKDKNKYINFVKNLRESANTIVITDKIKRQYHNVIEFTDEFNENRDNDFNVMSFDTKYLDWNITPTCVEPTIKNILSGRLFCYRIRNSKNEFSFEYLTSDKKKLIVNALVNHLRENPCNLKTAEEFQIVVSMILSMDMKYVNLLNNFDYGLEIPKIVVLDCNLSQYDACFLSLMNDIGIDIILLAPTGKSNVEKYLDIHELSLGYFEMNFDLEKASKTDIEVKQENEKIKQERKKEVDRKKKKFKENFEPNFVWPIGVFILFEIIMYIIRIPGWGQTIVQFCGIFFLAISLGVICDVTDDNHTKIKKLTKGAYITSFIVIIAFMLLRLCVFAYQCSRNPQANTAIYNGFQNINEEIITCENGFSIHQREDAIMQEDYSLVNLYVENNSLNEYDIVFEVVIGNSIVYRSADIAPLQYVKTVLLDTRLPLGDVNATIKYYKGNTYRDVNTREFLGEQNITIHVLTEDEYEDNEYRYGYEISE